MPDIVERLRNYDYRGNRPPEHAVMAEAADEIERLRAALAVKDNHDHFDCAAAMTKKDVKIETLRELLIDCATERDMYRVLDFGDRKDVERVAWEMATRAGERDAEIERLKGMSSDAIEVQIRLVARGGSWDVDVRLGDRLRSTMVRDTLPEAFLAAVDDASWMVLGPDPGGADDDR